MLADPTYSGAGGEKPSRSKTAEKQQGCCEQVLRRYDQLKSSRGNWDALWQDIGDLVMPRKANIRNTISVPNNDREKLLFDSTATRANVILANGQLSWMTPHESPWFAFEPARPLLNSEPVKKWLHICTEELRLKLASSNFYTEIHELYLDRGAFGTAALYVEGDGLGNLHFSNPDIGSFVVAEDDRGHVDTVFCEKEFTIRQLIAKFGQENLSEQIAEKLRGDSEGRCMDEKVTVIHCIMPRADADRLPGKIGPENMPVASLYIEQKSKHLLRVGGYEEMPTMVTRFLKWGSEPYGWSPSWVALPDAKQLNFIQKMMDVLAEVAAFPRMLVPSTLESEIDTRAHGVTYFDEHNPQARPAEWLTQGRYDIGKDRVLEKQRAIEQAFHVDLFRMFAQLDKQMTAREVAERSAEKLTQFSPTFSRMVTELFNPLLTRCFAVLMREGFLPPPPREAVQVSPFGEAFVAPPQVVYSSRIALAIRSLHNVGWQHTMEAALPLANIRPDVLDLWDFETAYRDMARNHGMPPEWIFDEKQVAAIRDARAKAAQKAQQMEMLERGAKAAGAVGVDLSKPPQRAA